MTLDRTGETLKQAARAAVRASIDALLDEELVDSGDGPAPDEIFRRVPPGSFLEDYDLTEQIALAVRTIDDLAPELRSYEADQLIPRTLLPERLRHRLDVKTWGQLREVRTHDLLVMRGVGLLTVGELLSSVRRAIDELRKPADDVSALAVPLALFSLSEIAETLPVQEGHELANAHQVGTQEAPPFAPRCGKKNSLT